MVEFPKLSQSYSKVVSMLLMQQSREVVLQLNIDTNIKGVIDIPIVFVFICVLNILIPNTNLIDQSMQCIRVDYKHIFSISTQSIKLEEHALVR